MAGNSRGKAAKGWDVAVTLLSYAAFVVPFYQLLRICGIFKVYMCDDAFISLRYADRLVNGLGLTWTDGKPVEGYSNLLWVLLNALLSLAGMDLVLAARVLGFASISAVFFLIVYHYFYREKYNALAVLAGLICIGYSMSISIWTIGGLETPMVLALLTGATVFLFRGIAPKGDEKNILISAILFGLLGITRLDGLVFLPAATLVLIFHGGLKKSAVKKYMLFAGIPAGILMLQVLFRLVYYGEFVPNTALVKLGVSGEHFIAGVKYLGFAFKSHYIFTVIFPAIALFFLFSNRGTLSKGFYLASQYAAWLLYVIVIGGDIFPAYRHFTEIIVISAFIIIEGMNVALSVFKKQPQKNMAAAAALAVLLFSTHVYERMQVKDDIYRSAAIEKWTTDGVIIGKMLGKGFKKEQPLTAISAAGAIPYASKLPSLDMLGINDYYLPRHKSADFGKGYIGHELGEGAYIWSQNPDLIIFTSPYGGEVPFWKSEHELLKLPEFRGRYKLITFSVVEKGAPVTTQVWVNVNGRAGLRIKNEEVIIPGYFAGNQATLSENGGFEAELHSYRTPPVIDWVKLEPGKWSAEVYPPGSAGLNVEYQSGAAMVKKYSKKGPVVFFSKEGGTQAKFWLKIIGDNRLKISEIIIRKMP